MGDGFIFGRRGRNLWRNQSETVLFSAAKGATYGATNRRRYSSRRPRARLLAQPIGDGSILRRQARNLWRNGFVLGRQGRHLWRNP
eukprot:5834810-Pyramimonas_sp.AAC.1